ncbi:MAG: TrmH family RNA methyltransferase [Aggregatilineales bacterium]
MTEKSNNPAGKQLESETLYERQKNLQNQVIGPVVVGAGVTDARNIGKILRIADALNCREVIFVDTPHADAHRIRKVSRTMSEKRPHRFISEDEFESEISRHKPLVAVEITSNSQDVFTCDLPQNATLVIGNERHGIPESILQQCEFAVHIPMFGINSSMNVATSLSIVLYEWYRRFYA